MRRRGACRYGVKRANHLRDLTKTVFFLRLRMKYLEVRLDLVALLFEDPVATIELIQSLIEQHMVSVIGSRFSKQSEAGPELEIIGRTKDV
jgi:hypothetical protein